MKHIIISYTRSRRTARTGHLVVPCNDEPIHTYEDLVRIVSNYLVTINKKFTETIIIDGESFFFDFDFRSFGSGSFGSGSFGSGSFGYALVDAVYNSFDVQYAIRFSGLEVLPPEQMLDALPDFNPFKEFRL